MCLLTTVARRAGSGGGKDASSNVYIVRGGSSDVRPSDWAWRGAGRRRSRRASTASLGPVKHANEIGPRECVVAPMKTSRPEARNKAIMLTAVAKRIEFSMYDPINFDSNTKTP